MKNKIGWCDMTWNPVWGCRNHCEYCYARKIANLRWTQMGKIEYHYYVKNPLCYVWTDTYLTGLKDFKPTFLESQYNKKLPKKPQRIFVGSMSEIYYWKDKWMGMVNEKINQYPQHTFMFLTQHPEVYAKYLWTKNCWFGVTITGNKPIERVGCIPTRKGLKFLSIEPILERIDIEIIDDFEPDWIIVGAETGNRKGKVIPNLDWVLNIVRYCEHHKIPVYIKDNLTKYYAECRGYKQFPEEVKPWKQSRTSLNQ